MCIADACRFGIKLFSIGKLKGEKYGKSIKKQLLDYDTCWGGPAIGI